MRCSLVAAIVLFGCSGSASKPSRDGEHAPPPAAADAPAPPPVDAAVAAISPDAAPPDAAPAIAIVDAPMKWSPERAALTLDYRRKHSDPKASDLEIDPKVIILHYTAGGSAKGTRDYFDNLEMESGRKDLAKAGRVNVSSHYIIDRDGTIYRLQPETRFARHCIGMNHIAIGIENVGDDSKWPLTDAQVDADAALIRDLVRRFPKITHLVGHHEVTTFHSPFYVELDPTYKNDKPDPGKRFMARVRAKVADLNLAGP